MASPATTKPAAPAYSGSLLVFFLLTVSITWTCFSALIPLSALPGTGAMILRGILLFLGIFTPAFVAVAMTARAEGRAGVNALLNRLFRWDVSWRWYVFAVAYMPVIKLTAATMQRLATGSWPAFGAEPWYLMAAATLFSTFLGGQSGEELGWRGYALPRLSLRFGLGRGSILLGIIWAAWHLPLFYVPRSDTYGQSFPIYLLGVTAISVAVAWLYAHTRGSLLLTMLMHAAINNTTGIVPSALPSPENPFAVQASLTAWLTIALVWIAAAYFLFTMPKPESMTA